jgi:hypothetical protein
MHAGKPGYDAPFRQTSRSIRASNSLHYQRVPWFVEPRVFTWSQSSTSRVVPLSLSRPDSLSSPSLPTENFQSLRLSFRKVLGTKRTKVDRVFSAGYESTAPLLVHAKNAFSLWCIDCRSRAMVIDQDCVFDAERTSPIGFAKARSEKTPPLQESPRPASSIIALAG